MIQQVNRQRVVPLSSKRHKTSTYSEVFFIILDSMMLSYRMWRRGSSVSMTASEAGNTEQDRCIRRNDGCLRLGSELRKY